MKSAWMKLATAVALLFLWVGAGQTYATGYEEVIYYHNDALGSPVVATDANGDVKWREEYSPYGSRLLHESREVHPQTGAQIESSWDEKQWFTGKLEETSLGIQYFGARWYEPEIGRFLSVDPVQFTESNIFSFNRYAYANNNPYVYIDPDGRSATAIYGAIAGATGGYIASGPSFREKVIGIVAGGIAGGAVGFVAPQTSHLVGFAAAGAVSSGLGQVVGSALNAGYAKGISNVELSDIKVDPITTAAGALGAGIGGLVGKGVATMTARPIVGSTIDKAGTPTATGLIAGSLSEGAVLGAAEKAAPIIKEKTKELTSK